MRRLPTLAFLATLAFPLWAQSFEVATVKPSAPTEDVVGMFTYPGGRIAATNYTLKMLMRDAYEIDIQSIRGGPSWTSELRYSVSALPPADSATTKINPSNPKLPPPPEERAMLRALLAERFHLKLHEEFHEADIYNLTVTRSGHKLKPPKDPNAFPYIGGGFSTRPGLIRSANATMELLSKSLTEMAHRPVVDRTGLAGRFDFEFEYATSLTDTSLPSLANALEEIGLHLTPTKGQVRYLIIDSATQPTEN